MKMLFKFFFLSTLLFNLIYSKCENEELVDEIDDNFYTNLNFDEHVNAKICSQRVLDGSETSLGGTKCCYFELVNCKFTYDSKTVTRNVKACVALTEYGVKHLDETIKINREFCDNYNADCDGTYLRKLLFFTFILIFFL